jgi:hypothetical protein
MKRKSLLQNAALVLILGLGLPVAATSQQVGERVSGQSGALRDFASGSGYLFPATRFLK